VWLKSVMSYDMDVKCEVISSSAALLNDLASYDRDCVKVS